MISRSLLFLLSTAALAASCSPTSVLPRLAPSSAARPEQDAPPASVTTALESEPPLPGVEDPRWSDLAVDGGVEVRHAH